MNKKLKTYIFSIGGAVVGFLFWLIVAYMILYKSMGVSAAIKIGEEKAAQAQESGEAADTSDSDSDEDKPSYSHADVPFAYRVMSDPISGFSIIAFFMAMSLLLSRWLVTKKESGIIDKDPFAIDKDTLLLPADARNLRQYFAELNPADKEFVLYRLWETSIQRARANWSSEDVSSALHSRSEIIQGEVEAEYATVRYLAWAIPSIGFVGTVLGIGQAMGAIGGGSGGNQIAAAAGYLNTAFDTTFVSLVLSLILMFFVYRIQADEDSLINRAVNYCMNNFVLKMHIDQQENP